MGNEIILSQRLRAILSLVDHGTIVADIGSDHGLLVKALITEGMAHKVYASENKKGPFAILKKTIADYELSHLIELRFADGLKGLPSDVTQVIIAGMGGDLIAKILESGREKLENVQTLVLQPNKAEPRLRVMLCDLGYYIDDEVIIFEDHYYEIIKARKGKRVYSDIEIELGPILLQKRNLVFLEKYRKRMEMINHLLSLPIPKDKEIILKKERERINNLWQIPKK